MDNIGLASLRQEGEEDGQCIEIEWKTLKPSDIEAMRTVCQMIPGWETEYNRLFAKASYDAQDDGRMDELAIELLNGYSIRETLRKIDAVNSLLA